MATEAAAYVRLACVQRLFRDAAVIVAATVAAFAAEAVGSGLDRPAVLARQPEHAVMIAGAAAGSRLVAIGERGLIVHSDDGGRSWRQSPTPVSVTLTAVRFADERHGFAIGHGATVLTTEDGGETWARRLDGRRAAAQLLADAQARNDRAAIQAAERLVADGPDKPLLDVMLAGRGRALVIGAYGLALATEDDGRTWQSWAERLDNPKGLHLYAVRQRGQRIVIVGEQGLVLKSEDGGRSFQRLATPYQGSWFTAELPSADEIVLAGLRGNVWRSLDGGANWSQQRLPIPASIVASQQQPDGTLLLVSQAGFILARRGDAFVPLNREPLPPLNGLVSTPGGALFALSIQGVLQVHGKQP